MKKITLETAWGKKLHGVEFEIHEFIDNLENNRNADNIKVDQQLQTLSFMDFDKHVCKLAVKDITCIKEYIEPDITVVYYHYQIYRMDTTKIEFTITSLAGE